MFDPIVTAALISTGGNLLGGMMNKGGGSAGGGVSADTQTGNTQLQYTPVGLESLDITPFEYQLLEEIFRKEQKEPQQMYHGGPLYLAEGDDIYKQEVIGQRPEEGIMSIETDIKPEMDIPQPSATVADFQKELDNMLRRQVMQDLVINEIPDIVKLIMDNRNKKPSVRGRGSIVPGAGQSGRSISNRDLRIAGTLLNPFTYRSMKEGGKPDAVLDRQMFAANPMLDGGDVQGPGGPKDDLIPVMASNGEFMLSKAAVDQVGGGDHAKGIARLEAFNELGNQRYG